MAQKNRQFTPEFRADVVRRMRGDDNIVAMSRELKLRRSVMYRWRAAFLKDGEAGLQSPMGRPPGRRDSHRRGTTMERLSGGSQNWSGVWGGRRWRTIF